VYLLLPFFGTNFQIKAVIFCTRLLCVLTQHSHHIVCSLPTLLKHPYHVPSSYAFSYSYKASLWVGTTPAAKSMPKTAIEDNCHDNEHNTKAPSNSSNCARSTSCANPAPLNDPQAKPECHFLSDNLSDYTNFDIREAFWPPPIFTRKLLRIASAQCRMTILLRKNLKLPLGYSLPSEKSPFELTFKFMFEM
jgi:hypothetical protein